MLDTSSVDKATMLKDLLPRGLPYMERAGTPTPPLGLCPRQSTRAHVRHQRGMTMKNCSPHRCQSKESGMNDGSERTMAANHAQRRWTSLLKMLEPPVNIAQEFRTGCEQKRVEEVIVRRDQVGSASGQTEKLHCLRQFG